MTTADENMGPWNAYVRMGGRVLQIRLLGQHFRHNPIELTRCQLGRLINTRPIQHCTQLRFACLYSKQLQEDMSSVMRGVNLRSPFSSNAIDAKATPLSIAKYSALQLYVRHAVSVAPTCIRVVQ